MGTGGSFKFGIELALPRVTPQLTPSTGPLVGDPWGHITNDIRSMDPAVLHSGLARLRAGGAAPGGAFAVAGISATRFGNKIHQIMAGSDPTYGNGNTIQAAPLTHDTMFAYLTEHFADVGVGGQLVDFSPPAVEGLYLLLRKGITPETLADFLVNPATAVVGGADQILRLVTLCYDRHVEGYETGFKPTERDRKFLDPDRSRIHSLTAEYFQALWLTANMPNPDAVTTVRIGATLAIDWRGITPAERAALQEFSADLPEDLRAHYAEQPQVAVDALMTTPTGTRVVEVKTTLGRTFAPGPTETAHNLLQVLRHALVVRQHRFVGIEYVIEAEGVSVDYLVKLQRTIAVTGVPYLIRLQGGEKTEVIAGGLSYDVHLGGIPERRTRELPLLPEHDPAEKVARKKTPSEAEAEDTALPWTKPIQAFLKSVIPRRLMSTKFSNAKDFIQAAQNAIRAAHHAEIATHLRDTVASVLTAHPDRASMIEAAIAQFARPQGDTLSTTSLHALVRIAQLATATEDDLESTEDTAASISANLAQALRFDGPGVATVIAHLLPAVEGAQVLVDEIAAFEQRTEPIHAEVATIIQTIAEGDPDAIVVYERANETFTLRRFLRLMEQTPGLGWMPDLVARLQQAIALYDQVQSQLAAVLARAIPPTAQPVEAVFASLPPDVLADLRDQVRALGPLPTRSRRVAAKGNGRPTSVATFDPARVTARYAHLVLVHPEDDPTHSYYFPEDLANIGQLVRWYLQQCGWDADRIAKEFPAMEAAALQALGGATAIASLDTYLPPTFQRTDRITATDPFSGTPLDVTRVVQDIWKRYGQATVSSTIRVVVMPDRTRIFFVNWNAVQAQFPNDAWQVPTYDQLKIILANQKNLPRFFNTLRARQGLAAVEWKEGMQMTLGGENKGNTTRVAGLRLVVPGDTKAIPKQAVYFHISGIISANQWLIEQVNGQRALPLALAARGLRDCSPIVAALLAQRWKSRYRSSTPLTIDVLRDAIVAEGIKPWWTALRKADPRLTDADKLVLRWQLLLQRRIAGLRLRTLAEEHLDPLYSHSSVSFLQRESRWIVTAAHMTGALAVAIAASGLNDLNTLEKSLLAGTWDTETKTKDPHDRLTTKTLFAALRTTGIAPLWALRRRVDPRLPTQPAQLIFRGTIATATATATATGVTVKAPRLLTPEEAAAEGLTKDKSAFSIPLRFDSTQWHVEESFTSRRHSAATAIAAAIRTGEAARISAPAAPDSDDKV